MRNQETLKKISQAVNSSIKRRRENGVLISAITPYGYIRDPKNKDKIIKDKNVYFIVYYIFDLYDKGYSFTSICDELNQRGIIIPKTYRENKDNLYFTSQVLYDNQKWNRGTIRRILMNQVYNGRSKYSDVKLHEEIITDELWYRVQNRINSWKNNKAKDVYDLNNNIFNAKLYCSECGESFTRYCNNHDYNSIDNMYLQCSCVDKRKRGYKCSNFHTIRYLDLLNIVEIYLKKELFNNLDYNKLNEMYKNDEFNNLYDYHINILNDEKKLLNNYIKITTNKLNNIYEINNNIQNIVVKLYLNNIDKSKERLKDIEYEKKKIFHLKRTFKINSEKELYIDRYFIEYFINKITIGPLSDNKRNISILLN